MVQNYQTIRNKWFKDEINIYLFFFFSFYIHKSSIVSIV